MTDLRSTSSAALDASRRFQAISLFVSIAAFMLLALQADDVWRSLRIVGVSYILGILTLVAVLLIGHFLVSLISYMYKKDAAQPEDPLAWYKAYFARFPLADNSCALIAFAATSTCFSAHKAKVIGAEGFQYDDLFIMWDRVLFFGRDPWELTHTLFPGATMTKWIDLLYHPMFLPMVLGYILCLATRARADLRYTYMLTYLASFVIIGMLMARELSSVGPVFYGDLIGNEAVFAGLLDRLDLQNEIAGPFTSVIAKDYLLNLHLDGQAGFFGGISAMPSMHVALAYMWAFAAWHINRILGVFLHIYAALIWIASVHLAWHYFVDGLVSLAALWIIWRFCGTAMGLYASNQVIRATT